MKANLKSLYQMDPTFHTPITHLLAFFRAAGWMDELLSARKKALMEMSIVKINLTGITFLGANMKIEAIFDERIK